MIKINFKAKNIISNLNNFFTKKKNNAVKIKKGNMIGYSDKFLSLKKKNEDVYQSIGLVEKAKECREMRYTYFEVTEVIDSQIVIMDPTGRKLILRASSFKLLSKEEIKIMKIKSLFQKT